MFYRLVIRLLTRIDQNLVHRFAYLYTYGFCKLSSFISNKQLLPSFPEDVFGLSFHNPVGLAAGFDREGKLLPYSNAAGFGFVEIGTVNLDCRKESDQKTLEIVQNLEKISTKYSDTDRQQLLGINLGSLGNDLDKQTVSDYAKGMELFWNQVDYFVINLSRPGSSTRALDPDMKGLSVFLENIMQQHEKFNSVYGVPVPIVTKLAIDYFQNKHIVSILLMIKGCGFDGVIIAFENWPDIKAISDYVRALRRQIKSFPFIVVGGIRSTEDARQILDAGASLVQIYTSLVQQGPKQTKKLISMLD